MSIDFKGTSSRSAATRVWAELDRMGNAGPLGDSYLVARDRREWAMCTIRSVSPPATIASRIAAMTRQWLGMHLISISHRLHGMPSVPTRSGNALAAVSLRVSN